MLRFEEETHSYWLGKQYLPSVSEVLAPVNVGYDDIPAHILAFAAARGHAIHAACALLAQKNLEWSTVDESIVGYVKAAALFLREAEVRVLGVEHRMCDPTLRYAGTLDLLALMGPHTCVFDWKATAVMPRTAGMQTAAYDALYRRNLGGTRPNKRYGVQLFEDGKYKLFPFTDPRDYSWFTSALNLWHWRNA